MNFNFKLPDFNNMLRTQLLIRTTKIDDDTDEFDLSIDFAKGADIGENDVVPLLAYSLVQSAKIPEAEYNECLNEVLDVIRKHLPPEERV